MPVLRLLGRLWFFFFVVSVDCYVEANRISFSFFFLNRRLVQEANI